MDKYLVGENLHNLQKLSDILDMPLTFVDLEATGLVHEKMFAIIEIGAIKITRNSVVESSSLVDPEMKIPPLITDITGINDNMVKGFPKFPYFNKFFTTTSNEDVLCGYNSKSFDATGIKRMGKKYKSEYTFENQLDFRHIFLKQRNSLTGVSSQKGSLVEACNFYNVKMPTVGTAHRAGFDIAITALLAEKIFEHHGLSILQREIDQLSNEKAKKRYLDYIHHHEKKVA